MNKDKGLSVLTIAATYIGTVVGAGFATGQEVFQFFTLFGWWGIVGQIISTILFIFFGYIIMGIAQDLKAKSHLEVIKYAGGKWLGTAIDWIITGFLFGAVVIMAAGAGAIFAEQFELPSIIGSTLIILMTLITVLLGLRNIIKAISIVVPFLLTAVLGVSLYAIFTNSITPDKLAYAQESVKAAAPNWLIAAILYVSYNMVLSVAVLAPLGVITNGKEKLFKGALLGGLGLGIGASTINLAMLANIYDTARFEVPMVFLATKFSPVVAIGYSIVLIMEVYTTAVGSLYGFVARLTVRESKNGKLYAVLASIGAFFAAQFGFSNMVKTVFPLVGYAGLLLLGGLAVFYFKEIYIRSTNSLVPAKPLRKKKK